MDTYRPRKKKVSKVKPMTPKKAVKNINKLTAQILKEKIPQRIAILRTKIDVLESYILFNGGK